VSRRRIKRAGRPKYTFGFRGAALPATVGNSAVRVLDPPLSNSARIDEFITAEKPPKAIHRSMIVKVVYLFD
jgi:hypothetical protein